MQAVYVPTAVEHHYDCSISNRAIEDKCELVNWMRSGADIRTYVQTYGRTYRTCLMWLHDQTTLRLWIKEQTLLTAYLNLR